MKWVAADRNWALALVLLASAWTMPQSAQALPEDREQPIYIQSDRAERDERKGTTVYTGDVEIDQGSLHISADRVLIETEADQVSRIIASGSPAKMHQKPALDREPVYARAKRIEYDVAKEILTLIDDASVDQEGTTVTGERISYFIQEQRVKATAGGKDSERRRVQMVIPPRRVLPAEGKAAEPAAAPSPAPTPPGPNETTEPADGGS
jgi:lipopolysaccharide export system protein LptA